jgi:Uma2 family endonuclease
VTNYPNPDLVIEVDISPSRIDMPGLYAALAIPEFWRIHKKTVTIEQLDSSGAYVAATRSEFLLVRPEDVTRWVFAEDASDPMVWKQRLRDWARTDRSTRSDAT